jgi:hypothetical protein
MTFTMDAARETKTNISEMVGKRVKSNSRSSGE